MWNKVKIWIESKDPKLTITSIVLVIIMMTAVGFIFGSNFAKNGFILRIDQEFAESYKGTSDYWTYMLAIASFVLVIISLFIMVFTAYFLWRSSEHANEQLLIQKKQREEDNLVFLDIDIDSDKISARPSLRRYSNQTPAFSAFVDFDYKIKNNTKNFALDVLCSLELPGEEPEDHNKDKKIDILTAESFQVIKDCSIYSVYYDTLTEHEFDELKAIRYSKRNHIAYDISDLFRDQKIIFTITYTDKIKRKYTTIIDFTLSTQIKKELLEEGKVKSIVQYVFEKTNYKVFIGENEFTN